MKKRTTLLLSAAVALISATALTTGVDLTSARDVKVKENTPLSIDGDQPLQRTTRVAHQVDGNFANAMRNAKKAKAAAPKKIAAASEVEGKYIFTYSDYFNQDTVTGEYPVVENSVTITANPDVENGIIISGLWGSFAEDLEATVDVENSTISIPRQLIYEYEGDTSADFVNVNDTTVAVTGVIGEDGVITLQNPWGAKLENAANYYVIGLNGVFTPFLSNAKMALTSNWYGSSEIDVLVTMNDDFTATVENFAGFGTATINLLYGNLVELPQQTLGNYYTSYLDHSSGSWHLGGSTVKGSGTETVITFDCNNSDKFFSFLTTSGSIGDAFTAASITLNADAGFTFLYPEEKPVLPGNAVMTYTDWIEGELEIGVTVTQNDDYTVTVEDFASMGTATLNMKYGGKVLLPQQTVGEYTTTYIDHSSGSWYLGDANVTGVGDETVITFDANANDKILTFLSGNSMAKRVTAAKITLNEDAGFTFLYPETEPDMPGSGTADEPFVIGTPDDLAGFIYQANENGKNFAGQYINVIADIDASAVQFSPIGSNDNKFAGTFDGGNHTIDGVSITSGDGNLGFFSYNNGVIKNLKLTNLTVAVAGAQNVGGIVGYNYATASTIDQVVVENCSVDNGDNGYIYGGRSVGAIVGYNQGTVRNCVGDEGAYIIGTSYLGGIVGTQARGKIENSIYLGYIVLRGAATEATGAGGIAGVAQNGSAISNVAFYGTLNAYSYATNTACGGILGRANGSANAKISVDKAYSAGSIYSDSIAGGLVGSANQLLLSNSESEATVCGIVQTQGNTAYAGGLIGKSLSATVDNCKSNGIVRGGYIRDLGQDGVSGGLIGVCNAGVATAVSNSFNAGSVAGGVEVAGILGEGGGKFTNVYNVGQVIPQGDATVSSGFVGKALNNLNIDGGYNAGAGAANGIIGEVAEGANITVDASFVTDFGAEDSYGTPITMKDLAAYSPEVSAGSPRHLNALSDEAAWEYGDDYTMPVLAGFKEDEAALANAAAVVLTGENDTYDNVTDVMNIGLPEGATWTFSSDVLGIHSDNPAQVDILDASTDEVTLTVQVGNTTKTWTVTLNTTKPMTAIDAINADSKDVKSVRYFDVNGRESSEPFNGVNIVVKTMTDGKVEVVKAVK